MGGAVFAQVSAHVQRREAPGPAPEAPGAYEKKGEESNGVIAMIDLLAKDLDKELAEAATMEKDSQADYETMMKDAAAKRAQDTKALTEKVAAKAEVEGDLQDHKEGKAGA